jgi:hypothetical protein
VYGQNFVYPSIRQKGVSINDFVPAGWRILDSVTGDLNNDKALDAVVILQHLDTASLANTKNHSNDSLHEHARILLILFKETSDNHFYIAQQSNTFILTHDDPLADDPYQSMTIHKGILQIDFHWYPNSGNWYNRSTYKFRHEQNDFFLIGAVYEEDNKSAHDYNRYSYDFLTKKRTLTKWDASKKIKKTETIFLDSISLKTISGLGQPNTWEVETGIYL